jgi:hypothetical protein
LSDEDNLGSDRGFDKDSDGGDLEIEDLGDDEEKIYDRSYERESGVNSDVADTGVIASGCVVNAGGTISLGVETGLGLDMDEGSDESVVENESVVDTEVAAASGGGASGDGWIDIDVEKDVDFDDENLGVRDDNIEIDNGKTVSGAQTVISSEGDHASSIEHGSSDLAGVIEGSHSLEVESVSHLDEKLDLDKIVDDNA